MSAPSAPPSREPAALHDRALADLSFIRQTMEGAASFTDVPGWGLVAVGVTALGAAALAAAQPSTERWLDVWLAEAVLAAAIGTGTLWRKIQIRQGPGLPPAARKFLLSFLPAVVAGGLLTAAAHDRPLLPGLWLLLYGTGIVTAGAFSVRIVPLMGLCFMVLGAVALLPTARPHSDLLLGLGFGAMQAGFGWVIARRHGG